MKKHHLREEYISANKRQRANAAGKKSERPQHTGSQRQVESSSVCCWMDYESIESIQTLSFKKIPLGMKVTSCVINASVASSPLTEIFLSRLHKEIIIPFRFTLSSQIQLLDSDKTVHDATERRNVIQQRIVFGYNNVSKLIFDANSNKATKPSLIILINPDSNYQKVSHLQQPRIGAAMLQHIPVLAKEMNIPLLLLPTSYYSESKSHGQAEHTTVETLAAIFGCISSHNKMMQLSCFAFEHKSHYLNQQELRLHQTIGARISTSTTTDDSMLDESSKQKQRIHNSIDSFVSYITGKMEN
jgi:hypothetical protein